MKLKSGFVLRKIAGENVIIPVGLDTINFNRLITLNESAVWLWENLQDKTFDENIIANMLVEHYGIYQELAKKDACKICKSWREIGVLE